MQFPAVHHFIPLRHKYSSKTPSICVLPLIRHAKFSHPYKTKGKIIVLCILVFISELNKLSVVKI